jgi:hypothetical protein
MTSFSKDKLNSLEPGNNYPLPVKLVTLKLTILSDQHVSFLHLYKSSIYRQHWDYSNRMEGWISILQQCCNYVKIPHSCFLWSSIALAGLDFQQLDMLLQQMHPNWLKL